MVYLYSWIEKTPNYQYFIVERYIFMKQTENQNQSVLYVALDKFFEGILSICTVKLRILFKLTMNIYI